jgi:HlyD family secretion protein
MRKVLGWVILLLLGAGSALAAGYQLGYVEPSRLLAQSAVQAPVADASAADAPSVAPVTQRIVIADGKVVPVQDAHVGLTMGGVVTALLVNEGDFVAAGELLLQLDDQDAQVAVRQAQADLMRTQARYAELVAGALPEDIAAAEANLAAATARLARLELSTANGDIGAYEAVLAQAQANLRAVTDGAAEAQLIEARAGLQNAEAELRRAQRAYNDVAWRNDVGATPQSAALETATNNFEAANARLADLENGATQAEIAQASAQVRQADAQLNALRSSRPADIAAAQAEVRSAQAQLDKLLAGSRPELVAQAEADVAAATARLQQQLVALAKLQLRAPIDGTVATLDVGLGEQVNPGVPVARMADFGQLQVETADLTELQVVEIQPGDRATITFDALPDVTVIGTVASIRPFGETSAGDIVYQVVLTLPEQDARLRWNMTATVTFD